MRKTFIHIGPSEPCGDNDCGVDHDSGWLIGLDGYTEIPDLPSDPILENADHVVVVDKDISVLFTANKSQRVKHNGYTFIPLKNAESGVVMCMMRRGYRDFSLRWRCYSAPGISW